MNKQEAIEKIKNLNARETFMSEIIWVKRDDVLDIIKQLDEPEKPKVPQVAVEFYERYKDDDLVLGEWFDDFYSPEAIEEFPRMDELTEWLYDNNYEINRQREFALATLVTLGIDAVEVEKEKLYEVFLKRTGAQLGVCVPHGEDKTQFTKVELQEYGFGNLDVYEVEEVKE